MKKIAENVFYIGVQDDNLDLFESQYPVMHGISYNSYAITGPENAVIDAVDVRRINDWFIYLDELFNSEGGSPDYLIIQHVEPDHSGSVAEFMNRYPSARLICTSKAADMLKEYFRHVDFENRVVIVGDGDKVKVGERELVFMTAPMVHWPEVMVTYDAVSGILFAADAFGTFAQWNSLVPWDAEGRRYYANIVGRFGVSVQGLLRKASVLKISAIAPLHGPLLNSDLGHYVSLYDRWSRYEPESDGVLVVYGSVYGGTADACRQLVSMLEKRGVKDIVLMDVARHDVSYIVAEAFRLRNIVVASVTLDGGIFPAIEDFIHHITRKNLANRRIALIDNGTWAPVAARLMKDYFSKMKNMEIIEPTLSIKSRLHPDDNLVLNEIADKLTIRNS